mmetsp:Transcript_27576/g.76393  ORF Transcript_27576/g.76393 Transcript_27576/m.76393 type:complete len:481 (-) Transcript_27576:8-1450(-)
MPHGAQLVLGASIVAALLGHEPLAAKLPGAEEAEACLPTRSGECGQGTADDESLEERSASDAEDMRMSLLQRLGGLHSGRRRSSTSMDWYDALDTNRTFAKLVEDEGLGEDLTPVEKELFLDRFVSHTKHVLTETVSKAGDYVSTAELLLKCFRDMRPVATEKSVRAINAGGRSWTAALRAWMRDVSRKDFQGMTGLDVSNANVLPEGEAASSSRAMDYIGDIVFDTRERWPHCNDTISHVRDQGKCASCWAFSMAGAADGRLCIETGGNFSGPGSYISAGYMASCIGTNGCRRGDPTAAGRFIARYGVPTGFDTKAPLESVGCVPYFTSGSALTHFQGSALATPRCPTSCDNEQYPRGLSADKFYPSGFQGVYMTIGDAEPVKASILSGGPVAIGFSCYSSFFTYASGIWDDACGRPPRNLHATTAIGFGPGYFLSVNSWGPDWGQNGLFKISECAAMYGFPINSRAKADATRGFPLPR